MQSLPPPDRNTTLLQSLQWIQSKFKQHAKEEV